MYVSVLSTRQYQHITLWVKVGRLRSIIWNPSGPRRYSTQNVGLGIFLVLIDYRLFVVWKFEFIELHLIGYYYLPCLRNIHFVPTDVVIRSKTEIDGLNSSGNVLAFSSPLLIQIHVSLTLEGPALRYILLPSVHVQIRSH